MSSDKTGRQNRQQRPAGLIPDGRLDPRPPRAVKPTYRGGRGGRSGINARRFTRAKSDASLVTKRDVTSVPGASANVASASLALAPSWHECPTFSTFRKCPLVYVYNSAAVGCRLMI